MRICIYTPILTTRIRYIMEFIFQDILKITPVFTHSVEEATSQTIPCISYGEKIAEDIPYFAASHFLLETEIIQFKLQKIKFADVFVPFPVQEGLLPFDIFAASFFLVSRYEEFVHKKYKKQPFTASDSYQKKENCLNKPLINDWAFLLKNILKSKFPDFIFPQKQFQNIPCIITVPTLQRPKGLIKKSKLFISDITHKDGRKKIIDNLAGLGYNELLNKEFLNNLYLQNNLEGHFFLDTGSYSNVSSIIKHFFNTIHKPSRFGIFQPSDLSSISAAVEPFKAELKTLKIPDILRTQQLDNLILPTYYLRLLNIGTQVDYSMGYKNHTGFRAGTCTPFKWYDLQLEKPSELTVYPYCITDFALIEMGATAAKSRIETLIERVQLVEGTFCTVWQLKNLSNNVKFKKWHYLYEFMTNYAKI